VKSILFLPTECGQALDPWDSAGLRGTGSHHLVFRGCRYRPSCLSTRSSAQLSLANQHAVRAVDGVFRLAGAGAGYADQPLQRCFRELHTLDTHTFLGAEARIRYSKHLLGVLPPPQLL
jgi:indole-3-acetate monooxygenase